MNAKKLKALRKHVREVADFGTKAMAGDVSGVTPKHIKRAVDVVAKQRTK